MRNRRPNNSRRKKSSGSSEKSGERSFSKRAKVSRNSSHRGRDTQSDGQSNSNKRRGGQRRTEEHEGSLVLERHLNLETQKKVEDTHNRVLFRKKSSEPQKRHKQDKRCQSPVRGKSKVGAKPRTMVGIFLECKRRRFSIIRMAKEH